MKSLRILAACLLFLVLTYALSPQLLAWQARNWLSQLPCDAPVFEIDYPAYQQIRLNKLAVKNCTAFNLTALQASQIELTFHPLELLFGGHLTKVVVEGLDVQLAPGEDSPPPPLAIAGLLPTPWLERLPIDRIELTFASIRYPLPQGTVELAGTLNLQPQGLHTALKFIQSPYPLDGLSADWTRDNHFAVDLYRGDHAYRLQGDLEIGPDRFELNADDHLDLALIAPLLSTNATAQPIDLQGTVRNHWRLHGGLLIDPSQPLKGLKIHQALASDLTLTANTGAIQQGRARVSAEIDWTEHQLDWQLAPSSTAAVTLRADPSWPRALPLGWALNPQAPLRGRLDWSNEPAVSMPTGVLTLQSAPPGPVNITARLSHLRWTNNDGSARFALDADTKHYQQLNISLGPARIQSSGTLQTTPNGIQLHLDTRTRVAAGNIAIPQARLSDVTVTTTSPLAIRVDLASHHTRTGAISLDYRAQAIRAGNHQIRDTTGTLQLGAINSLDSANLSGRLQLNASQLGNDRASIEALAATLPFRLQYPRFSSHFDLSGRHKDLPLQLSGEIRGDLRHSTLEADWQLLPIPLNALWPLATDYVKAIPKALTANAGSLSAQGTGSFNAGPWQIDGRLQLADAALSQPQWQLSDLNSHLNFSLDSARPPSASGELVIDRLDGPVAIRQLRGRFQYRPPHLWVQQAELLMLNGKVHVEPFQLDMQEFKGSTSLYIERFSLAEIFGLHQRLSGQAFAPLSGEGTLSGILPLAWTRDQITITDGDLRALPPGGVIHYRPLGGQAALAQTNPASKMAMSIVENFQFQQLSSEIDFDSAGTLWLSNTLRGSNPNWQKGQPVVLNVPVEYAGLIGLYQALRYSDTLIKSLSDKYQGR